MSLICRELTYIEGLSQLHIMPQLPLTLAQIVEVAVEMLLGCPFSLSVPFHKKFIREISNAFFEEPSKPKGMHLDVRLAEGVPPSFSNVLDLLF